MSFTPFNAPLLSGLLGDTEIAAQFSVKAEIAAMLKFESALAVAQSSAGLIVESDAREIEKVCERFEPDLTQLQAGVIRDGMVVPEFVRQLRFACGGEVGTSLHFGATSQDVIDTSFILRLAEVQKTIRLRLNTLLENLAELENEFGDNKLMARTRMQAALPVTVGHRISQWRRPIEGLLASLEQVEKQLFVLQLGGPVGDLAQMDSKGAEVRKFLSGALNLEGCVDIGLERHAL